MWPVLALGILTAIVAWIWYRGSGERKEPEPVQKQESGGQGEPSASSQRETVQGESSPEDERPASSAHCGSSLNTPLTSAEPDLSAADDPCEPQYSERGEPCPKIQEKVLHTDVFQAQEVTKVEDLSDVDPLDLKVQSNIQAATNPSPSVEAEVGAGEERLAEVGAGEERLAEVGAGEERLAEVGAGEERLAEVGAGEERLAEVGAGEERLAEVANRVHLPGATQEQNSDSALPADIKRRPPALELDVEEHLPAATERDELQADTLGSQAGAQSFPGVGAYSTGVLAAGRALGDGDLGFVVPVSEDALCPAAERLLGDSFSSSWSDVGKALVPQGDGEETVNGADGEAETGPGGQPENSCFGKENAVNVLESEETLKQEPCREIGILSDIDQDEGLEKCDHKRTSECNDIGKSSTRSLENADVFDGSLNTSTSEALCDFQEMGTYPEGSSMEMHSVFNQEKAVSGLSSSNINENTVYGPSEANINEADLQKTKKVATIQPMPQNVNFGLKVHYITHSDSQIIAVTGDHEKLGKWEKYVPLTSGKDGFWSHSMTLPADTNVAWKFIMVENGKIRRWEECNNRLLKVTHEDIEGLLFWGYP